MTSHEAAVVRDLRARLRLAQEAIRRLEAEKHAQASRYERRISYLKRDKTTALARAAEAVNSTRYWHGVALTRREVA